jgi:hypothetical protein
MKTPRTFLIVLVGLAGLLFILTGCATIYPSGAIYTNVQLPVTVTDNAGTPMKTGTAQATSILGLVATGDASIEAAKKNGNITKVYHVDWDAMNVLGIYGRYTVTVYGE